MTPNKLPSVTLSLYLCLSHHLESFFSSSHHCLCSIHHYATSIWSSLVRINFIIAISICLSTQISIGLPLSHWDKSYPYPSLLLNLYWTLGWVYHLHPLLLTAWLGHPPIGQHHPHLTIYTIFKFSSMNSLHVSTSWGFSGYIFATFGMNGSFSSMAWSKSRRGGRVSKVCLEKTSA